MLVILTQKNSFYQLLGYSVTNITKFNSISNLSVSFSKYDLNKNFQDFKPTL